MARAAAARAAGGGRAAARARPDGGRRRRPRTRSRRAAAAADAAAAVEAGAAAAVVAARGEASCWGVDGGGHETLVPAARGALSFAERVWVTPEGSTMGPMAQRVGYDAEGDTAWEVDLSGTALTLTGEERELVLMAGWVRTGQWRAALEAGALEVSEAPASKTGGGDDGACISLVRLPGGALLGELKLDSEGMPTELKMETAAGLERWTFAGPWHSVVDGVVAPSFHQHFPAAGGDSTFVISSENVELQTDASADARADEESGDGEIASSFAIDMDAVTALRTAVDTAAAARVPCCRGDGGHILARARTGDAGDGGAEIPGWVVIDTAAGGALCISPAAADELGMEKFGEVWLNGVGGGIKCALRRCEAFALGQVTLVRPVFVEMELGDAVRPASAVRGRRANVRSSAAERNNRIIGAVGAAILRRSVLELRLGKRDPWAAGAPPMALSVHAPEQYEAPTERAETAWQGLSYEYGVPHLEAVLRATNEGGPESEGGESGGGDGREPSGGGAMRWQSGSGVESVLLKLSFGVGGCGLILRRQTAARIGVESAIEASGVVSGAGSERARMARIGQPLPETNRSRDAEQGGVSAPPGVGDEDVFSTRLAAVEFKGATMRGVRALVHKGELPQDIELAEAAGGAACAQLLDGGTLLCLDVPGDRVSISRLDKYFT